MTNNYQISDSFLSAAEIESEPPITVGANMVGTDGYLIRPQDLHPQNWHFWANNFPLEEIKRLMLSPLTAQADSPTLSKK